MKKETLFFISLWAIFGLIRIWLHLKTKGKVKLKTGDNIGITMILPYILSVIVSILEYELTDIKTVWFLSLLGVFFFIIGSTIQISGLIKLGDKFSNVVELQNDHDLVKSGIYKIIRHPIYLGIILMSFSSILILNTIYPLIFVIASFASIIARIQKEEKYLKNNLQGYADYTKKTSALIPGIY
jgi:protein-S-isoprenylcysteine O-methyltransferase Ste14